MTVRLEPSNAIRLPCEEGLEAVACAHDAGFGQLLIKLSHRLKQLFRGEDALFAVLGSLHEHHHTHIDCLLFAFDWEDVVLRVLAAVKATLWRGYSCRKRPAFERRDVRFGSEADMLG